MGTYYWTANRLAPKSSTVGECTRRVSYRPEKGRYRIGYSRWITGTTQQTRPYPTHFYGDRDATGRRTTRTARSSLRPRLLRFPRRPPHLRFPIV